MASPTTLEPPADAATDRPTVLPAGTPLRTRAWRFTVRIFRGMWVHGALDAAASMAFNFFLSLIPLMVLVGFILGHLVRTNGVEAFMQPLLDTLPSSAAEIVGGELQRLAGARGGTIAPLSVVTFFWLASSGLNHMMNVFQKVVRATPRRWWKQRAIAIGCVVGSIGMVSFTSWAIFEADAALHRGEARMPRLSISWSGAKSSARTGDHSPGLHESKTLHGEKKRTTLRLIHKSWENLAALSLAGAVGVSGLAFFYRFAVERPKGHRRRALPGALAACGVWLLVSWAFGNYVISLGEYAVYYGSLAAVAVLLVWLYLTSLALLLGAEVNAILEGVRDVPAT
jgi:membrane protein